MHQKLYQLEIYANLLNSYIAPKIPSVRDQSQITKFIHCTQNPLDV